MSTYADLCSAAKRANSELNDHRVNGAASVTEIISGALQALGGPAGWWWFDDKYKVDVRTGSTMIAGVYMEQSSGDILCRVFMRFLVGSEATGLVLHMPIRAKALADGVIQFTIYEGENNAESVATFDPNDEPKFRASFYKAIEDAFSALRPPGHRFVGADPHNT